MLPREMERERVRSDGRQGEEVGTHNAGSTSTYQAGCGGRFFRRFERWRGRIVPLPKRHGILQTGAALHLPRRTRWRTPPGAPAQDTRDEKTEAKKKNGEKKKTQKQHAREKRERMKRHQEENAKTMNFVKEQKQKHGRMRKMTDAQCVKYKKVQLVVTHETPEKPSS